LKSVSSYQEIPDVICHDGIGMTVDSSFKYHFVTRIAKLWPPLKPYLDGFASAGQSRQETVYVVQVKPRYKALLWPFQDVLVFEE
jgi:hypothetical protein